MGTEQDPIIYPIHSLIVRCRAYQTKRQGGAGRGLFKRYTRSILGVCGANSLVVLANAKTTLVCPKCRREMKVIAVITDPFEVNKILEYLKRNNAPPFDKEVTKAS